MVFEYAYRRLFHGASRGVIGALAVCLPFAAQAATATATPGEGTLEEVVVTAQKRSEALSKTPLAISVIGQQSLDNVGARSFTDAVTTLPNVSTGLGQTIAIRGLGTSTLSQTNGTVAFHIDGIFQNAKDQGTANIYDVQRIEVLRGPQGTLYGRNATAGVVNVLTNDAGPDYEAFGDVSYGRFNTLAVRGVVNVPITDAFALRLTGTYDKSDSWKDVAGDHPRFQDVMDLRLAWKAKPTDAITWDGRFEYNYNRGVQPVGVPYFFYNAATKSFLPTGNPRNSAELGSVVGRNGLQTNLGIGVPYNSTYRGVDYDQANTKKTENFSVRSKLRFDLSDQLSLTYIAGYTNVKTRPNSLTSGLVALQIANEVIRINDWSHEINLNYDADGIKAVLGAYSFDHRQEQPGGSINRIFGFTPNPAGAGAVLDYTVPQIENSSVSPLDKDVTRAIFGQATVSVTDALRLTGGARYNWDRSSYAAFTASQCPFGAGLDALRPDVATFPVIPLFPLGGAPVCSTFARLTPTFYVNRPFAGASKSFEKFGWKATAEYDVNPDILAYATVATGYKAGGVADRQAAGDLRFYKPETNISYEAGIKTRLLENTLSLNLTAFWTDYKDLQIAFVNPDNPAQILNKNAGKSRSRGLEFEYAWAPTSSDRIQGFMTYLDAKFRDFPSQDPLTNVPQNFAGQRLPASPKFAARINYSHIFDLGGGGTITPTAQFYYQGTTYQSFANSIATRVPDYTRSNLIVRYETEKKNISVEAFVNNIENKQILTSFFPIAGVAIGYYGPPRTYGMRFGLRY